MRSPINPQIVRQDLVPRDKRPESYVNSSLGSLSEVCARAQVLHYEVVLRVQQDVTELCEGCRLLCVKVVLTGLCLVPYVSNQESYYFIDPCDLIHSQISERHAWNDCYDGDLRDLGQVPIQPNVDLHLGVDDVLESI